ncbi:uncharacterized protein LOC134793057 [Cydia splendana]|uniref:uncharacterized protein LOC134793057 n=1 Tax=Cydia splendana TaxID=1100963 RepID=UPI00300D14FC
MNHAKLCLCFVLVVLTVNLIECKGGHGGGGHGGSHGHSSSGHSSHSSHGSHSSGGGWFSGWSSGGSKSSGSSSHSYPASTGYSGHGSGGSHTYPNSHGLSGSGGSYWSSSHYYRPSRPTYYTAPQYVYVTSYRETQSPYSNLLTGLTMYNLGRSHHYDNHYYNDGYQRSGSSGGYYNHHSNTGSEWQNNNAAGTNDEAKCVLKIQKNGKLEVLSIPCAIVSTFDNGNHTSNDAAKETTGISNCTSAVNMNMTMESIDINSTSVNNTVVNPCVNQTVDIKDPLSVTGAPIAEATNMECSVEIITKQNVIQNSVDCNTLLKYAKMAVPEDKSTNVLPSREALKTMLNKPPWWASLLIAVEADEVVAVAVDVEEAVYLAAFGEKVLPDTLIQRLPDILAEEKANEDKDEATCLMRVTEDEKEEVLKIPCAIVTTFADGNRKLPYAMTGSPLDANVMNCTVEIWTRQEVISNEVDCEVLLKYAKMPVPQNKDAIIMPPRSELKEMLEHPPWWLSLFLARSVMANRIFLLCLVLSISFACYFESVAGTPGRGGSSRGGGSRGGGSRGGGSSSWGRGGSSSSSGSSWSSSYSKPSYPSSGGLSGYGSGSKPSYPSSSSGLSGSNSWSSWNSKPSYPSSGGLSGYGSGSKPSYPSSSGGLSGYGSGQKPSYPSSSTGLSGSGSGSSSSSGSSWSWWGSSSNKQTNNKYGNNYATPHHTGNHVVNNHITNNYHTPNVYHTSHPYYSSPQYVYVTEYRNSGSRYGDILTGLALYNLGRSQSHYHDDHYYHDDYYRRRYNSDSMNSNYSPQNAAVCTMKITENGRVETLKIPCEIVSTFTNEGKLVKMPQSQVNSTTCVTNSTMVNSTAPVNTTSVNATVSSNVTMINSTTCTFTVNATDPLKVKGPPINPSNMKCEVEVRTRDLLTSNSVDCNTLLRYSKMPEPAKSDNTILPERQRLKQILHNPPWWMSLFIAV